MCTTCGCGHADGAGVTIDGAGARQPPGRRAGHAHGDSSRREHEARGMAGRLIRLEEDLLAKNASLAEANRRLFAERRMFVANLVSSPGSGKTTLLARTATDLKKRLPMVVIEGDQQTSRDAARIRAAGVPAVQINTGKLCHLDAHMVGHAIERLDLPCGGVLFIENVGNLVCPASFDLGENHKVVIVSVTEGDDKPLKYPNMFAAADLMIINKIDLLPHVDFDVARCTHYARRLRPDLSVIELSATTGRGLAPWYAWLEAGAAHAGSTASPIRAAAQ